MKKEISDEELRRLSLERQQRRVKEGHEFAQFNSTSFNCVDKGYRLPFIIGGKEEKGHKK